MDQASERRRKKRRLKGGGEDNDDDAEEDEKCEVEVWETLSRSFRQVETVLDRNRMLIRQVNVNHQSKIPDNLARNVALICEINGNIAKVLSIYSDLSVNFSNIVHQRRADGNKVESRESVKQSIQQ